MNIKELNKYKEILKSKVKTIYDFTLNEYNSINEFNKQQKEIYFNIFKKDIPDDLTMKQKSLEIALKENIIQIVTLYNLQINPLTIPSNKISFEDIYNDIEDIFIKCLNRITYNKYNKSYSIKFNRRLINGYIANKSFIFTFITFLRNIRGENIELKEYNKLKYEFIINNNFEPIKKHKINNNISFKVFKKRKVLTVYFD